MHLKKQIFHSWRSSFIFKSLVCAVAVLLSLYSRSQLLPAPLWSCIQTQPNDVVLNWQSVNDPNGDFVQYEVYTLTDGLIHTETNINNTNFTHPGVTDVRDYFLKTISAGGENTSDTLQNIQLDLINLGNGTAILNWNDPGKNISNPNNDQTYIWRTDGTGSIGLRDSVDRPVSLYRDTIDICSGTMEYQIRVPGNTCDFTSTIESDYFEDNTSPYIPELQTVSIDSNTQNVELTWNANGARDTYGYIIYKRDSNGILFEIDTVWGRFNTSYSYSDNTTDGPLSYSIAAFDSCFTQSTPPTYQTSAKGSVKTSTYLSGQYDACLGMVSLNWTSYSHFGNNPNITIFYLDQGVWKDEPAMTGNAHNITFSTADTYSFVIRYKAADGREIFSNKIDISTSDVLSANINYLATASVEDGKVELVHYLDPPTFVQAIAFSRKDNEGVFKEIGRVNVDDAWTSFTDQQVKTNQVNEYTCHLIDQCGNKVSQSNVAKTIFLQVSSNGNEYMNDLNWTSYEGFEGGVEEYELYRVVDGITENNPFAIVGPNVNSHTDDIDNVVVNETICYQVVAVENTNTYGFSQWAGSNQACAPYESKIFVPNAFTPNGANPRFRPVFSFNEYLEFEMRIFNRWGKLIYQTNDPYQGWDGSILSSGENATPEIYSYWMKFKDVNEKESVFQGHVTLIR